MKRQRWYWGVVAAGAALGLGFVGTDGASRGPIAEWKLVWSDEFDGKQIDRGKWDFDIGNGDGGWGNAELEYYTNEPKNAFVEDGALHLRAIKEKREGFGYTSATSRLGNRMGNRCSTRNTANSSFGRSFRQARGRGRRSGCCRRMRSTEAGRLRARST